MSCLAHSTYTMTADIYEPTTTRNATNGMVTKSWALQKTVSCYARGILGSQLGGNSAQVDLKDYITITKDFIKIRTADPISTEYRVVAIRNSEGNIWTEDYIQNTAGGLDGATIFEPSGTTPLLDYLGKVLEYETVLKRQEIQSLEVD
jgi:hypothetical protein